jgi:hypothetical protein
MTAVSAETEWIENLTPDFAVRFLARLSWEITIVGRNSYAAGTDELADPRQLRRVNEILHRVTACLSQLLERTCSDEFVQSIATWVLAEQDEELRSLLQRSWINSRKYVAGE